MSAFQNFLTQQKQETEQANFGGGNNDGYKPKNPIIRLNKDKREIYVRILPPVDDNSFQFAKPFRTTFINYTKKSGEMGGAGLILPFEPGTSVIDPFISHWLEQGVKFSRYPNTPGRRYYINVVELVSSPQGVSYALDEQGNIKSSPMEIPLTAYNLILNNLSDQYMSPQGVDKSFISEDNAFMVKFEQPPKNSQSMTWDVKVYPNQALGKLPENWKEVTADLEQLGTPTEETSPDFVNFLINKVQGTDLNTKNFAFESQNDNNPKQSSDSFVDPMAGGFSQGNPFANGAMQTQGQAPQGNTGAPVGQPMQQQMQPPQPQFQQQPMGQPMGQPQFQQPPMQQQMQQPATQPIQQQQQQPDWNQLDKDIDDMFPPVNGAEQQPPQQQQMQQPPKTNQPPNVDEVLAGLDLDM